MILNVSDLNKAYLEKPVLKNVSFHLEDKEKAAIVGINGSGKTTILRIIMGEEEPDSGVIAISKGKKIAYLAQKHADFEQGDREHDILSGGQKTKKRLEEILLDKPDFLILDEPTNHLDIASVQWLEKVLKRYDGAVLLVSHDRYFLDRIVRKIIDLDNGFVRSYKGNYSEYAAKKKVIREAALKAYLKQQDEIRHQEEVIKKLKQFNREKSIKRAESREKLLNKMERLDRPEYPAQEMRLVLSPNIISGKDVLSVKGLSKAFGQKRLFSNVNLEIKRGEHVAVIGRNGSGKTTLLKVLNLLESADEGEFTLGSNVRIAYYDQEHAVLDMEKTIFQEIQDTYPNMDNGRVRSVLAAFLFTGDDVFKRIGDLSGGEQGRVSLAKLMLSDANFLIMDEPTNHLDIQSREVLEDAIQSYEGTILCVSHDRYFINKISDRILELFEGRFDDYIGNYDYYLSKQEDVRKYRRQQYSDSAGFYEGGDDNYLAGNKSNYTVSKVNAKDNAKANSKVNAKDMDYTGENTRYRDVAAGVNEASGKENWAKQKERQSILRKAENRKKRIETEIAALEDKIAGLDEKMQDPALSSDAEKLMELNEHREEAEIKLSKLYEQWEEAAEELDRLLNLNL